MDLRNCYRDKFGEAGTSVPCTYFNNELIYFGRSQVVYRLGNEIALANALIEKLAAITGFDIATDRELHLREGLGTRLLKSLPPVVYVIWAKWLQWPLIEHYSHPFRSAPSGAGGGQIVIHGRSGNIEAISSSGYGRAVAAVSLTRGHIGETTGVWYIQPNTSATFKCKRSGGVQELFTPVCGKWRWTSSDFIHVQVAEEAVVNDSGVLVRAIAKVSKYADKCENFSPRFTSAVITGLPVYCPQPSSYFDSYSFEENLVETILHIDIDGVPTLHEVRAIRKSFFKENTNQLPTTVGLLVTALGDNRREIEQRCDDWVRTLHEVRAVRKSYLEENTNQLPTTVGLLVTALSDNRREIEQRCDDWVLTLHEVRAVRKSFFKENTNQLPTTVGLLVTALGDNRREIEPRCDDWVLTLHEVRAVRKSYFEENTNQLPTTVGLLVTALSDNRREIEQRCDDWVLTLHEVRAVRKSYFEEKTNQLPTTVGLLVTALSDNRREIEPRCDDWALTLHEVRKSCLKDVNTSPRPAIVGRLVTVTVLIDNQSEVETSEVVETLLHSDDDQVLNLRREAKPVRKSYFREQSSLDPTYVRANQDSNAVVNGSTFKVGILRNRTISIDVIQMCFFDETMLLLLVKNQVLLRGGSLTFCARCLNRRAKTCRSHIISRCVQGQILGNNTCIWISQKEELVSSNNCWFRLLCPNCDNSTCVDENKFKKRFCAEELKVSPQKIPAVELRVIYAFFFRGIMANIDLLLSIARNQESREILNCVLRLREQCIKPRSAIKVSSCKLSNDSALRSHSLEFPILVSSEKWGSFFYLQLRQYCYAIPIEQLQQDSLQANFPAIAKAISSKLGQKREKYLRNFSKPINQALMVTGYVTGGQLFI